MKEFFEFLKAHINATVPEFKTVRMFNDQLAKGNAERTEKAFRYPAVFIQLVTSEVRNRSLGIQDAVVQVILHIALEGYKFSEKRQLDDMDLTAKLDAQVHRLRGVETDPVQFTSLQRIIIGESENFDNVNTPIFTYMTMLRLMGSYRTPVTVTPWEYIVEGSILE